MHSTGFLYRNDAQMIQAMMAGNEAAIRYVFYEHYKPLLCYNFSKAVGDRAVELDDLIHELFLFLMKDNWARLGQYNPQTPFAPWFSVVSYRFFKKYSKGMTEIGNENTIYGKRTTVLSSDLRKDLERLLDGLEPPIRKKVMRALLLEDADPAELAERYQTSVNQIYLIKSRTIQYLREMLKD